MHFLFIFIHLCIHLGKLDSDGKWVGSANSTVLVVKSPVKGMVHNWHAVHLWLTQRSGSDGGGEL